MNTKFVVQQPESLELVADLLVRAQRCLLDCAERLSTVFLSGVWIGVAADAAEAAVASAVGDLRELVDDLEAVCSILRTAVVEAVDLLIRIARAELLLAAAAVGWVIHAVAALDWWLATRLTSAGVLDRGVLPSHSTGDRPAAAGGAEWWWSLGPEQQALLLRDHPDRIGNVDGIPASVRDAANRRRLVTERARLERHAEQLRADLDDNLFGGFFSNADAGLDQTEKRLAALDSLETTLALADRKLLVLDNSGDKETLAAVAIGDIDTAEHVAVFVPGVGSTVQDSLGRYDSELSGVVDRAREQLGSDSVAAVTWLGYETPNLGWDVLDPDHSLVAPIAAHDGGQALASFLGTLDPDQHVSVIAHSYGSVTAAYALSGRAAVDDVVMMGSPGLGVVDRSVLGADNVYVMESPTDPIADAGWFGTDPNRLAGAVILSGADSFGHGAYLEPGTIGAENVASVVSGAREPERAAVAFDPLDVVRIVLGAAE